RDWRTYPRAQGKTGGEPGAAWSRVRMGSARLRASPCGGGVGSAHLSRRRSHSRVGLPLLAPPVSLERRGGDGEFLCRYAGRLIGGRCRSQRTHGNSLQTGGNAGHAGGQELRSRARVPGLGQVSDHGNGGILTPAARIWSAFFRSPL